MAAQRISTETSDTGALVTSNGSKAGTAYNCTLSAAGSLPLAPRVLRSPAVGFSPERAKYQVLEGTLRAPTAFVTGARRGKI